MIIITADITGIKPDGKGEFPDYLKIYISVKYLY